MNFKDFKIKVICMYDSTFWLHILRDLLIFLCGSLLSVEVGVGLSVGFNFAWEWQDGLHNDGFNILDFIAGLLGVIIGYTVIR